MYRLFPHIYILFLTPLFVGDLTKVKVATVMLSVILSFTISPLMVRTMGALIFTSLLTLLPFLLVVQGAVCSGGTGNDIANTVNCAAQASLNVMLNLGVAVSALLLASANEWRGSLLDTVNGLRIPRSLRMMFVVSGVMIGDFRKAMSRVHHAFTARGEASPSFSISNVTVLPRMLACTWAAVLSLAAERLSNNWSAPSFWDAFIPPSDQMSVPIARSVRQDVAIIAVSITIFVLSIWIRIGA